MGQRPTQYGHCYDASLVGKQIVFKILRIIGEHYPCLWKWCSGCPHLNEKPIFCNIHIFTNNHLSGYFAIFFDCGKQLPLLAILNGTFQERFSIKSKCFLVFNLSNLTDWIQEFLKSKKKRDWPFDCSCDWESMTLKLISSLGSYVWIVFILIPDFTTSPPEYTFWKHHQNYSLLHRRVVGKSMKMWIWNMTSEGEIS